MDRRGGTERVLANGGLTRSPRSADLRLGGRARKAFAGLVVCGVLGFAALVAGCASGTGSVASSTVPATTAAPPPARKAVTHDFVIPPGTAERLRQGEDPAVIPQRLDVHVGDRIRVRNDDTEKARLGIFDVDPGETTTMKFMEESVLTGTYFGAESGGCGTPPPEAKKFIINVRP